MKPEDTLISQARGKIESPFSSIEKNTKLL